MTSSRFEELERRCLKLKKERIIRFIALFTVLSLIAFGGYYWVNASTQPSNELPVSTAIAVSDENVSSPSLEDKNESTASVDEVPTLPPIEVPDETLFLEPHVYKAKTTLPVNEFQEAKRSIDAEQHLLKAFQEKQNFSNAYALAHFYLEQKSYSEAVFWAKEASKHDSRSALSWLVYAKAKFSLGERAEAIRSLELFLSYINSKEAKELLNFYKGQE